jgi:hypothetical protein
VVKNTPKGENNDSDKNDISICQYFVYLWIGRLGHTHAWAVNAVDSEGVFESKIFEDNRVVSHTAQA